MLGYIIDFTLVALLIIGITAVIGVVLNGIGEKFFGGKTKNVSFDNAANTQTGWKNVGGNAKKSWWNN